jgi:hypothetical protein
MSNATIEQRLADLETQVTELRLKVEKRIPAKDWLTRMTGAFSKYPEFAEIVEEGRRLANAQAEAVDEDAA